MKGHSQFETTFFRALKKGCLSELIEGSGISPQLYYVGHAVKHPKGEPIRDLLLLTNGGQLKMWTNMQTWRPSPDRESSATHNGERTG